MLVKVNNEQKKHLERIESILSLQVLANDRLNEIVLVTPTQDEFLSTYESISRLKGAFVQPDFAIVRSPQIQKRKVNNHASSQTLQRLRNYQCNSSIKPSRIAIIDDGFNLSESAFSLFNVLLAYDADSQNIISAKTKSEATHGNMIASVIAHQLQFKTKNKAKVDAELVAIKQASTLNSAMILAFSISLKMNVDIINSSWTLPFVSQLLSEVIEQGLNHGGVAYVVVSAGNHGKDACIGNKLSEVKGVTTVGALSGDGTLAPFSNFGRCVDLYAPATLSLKKKNTSFIASGTSTAAALVTGELSYLLSCGLSSSEIGFNNNN
ncbi:S8 family peptidase [Pseudoalteromonas luteoviolacea]|uniref:S8 family peptidase n=1 Tax=Pseudoalteromonas luteoviolacea TaxID=43657 RepID=UPI001B3748E7|nr:S8/S53 family peptidase [Pseudoalteromonas luteoviolacea]MBQ4837782.1 S8/S53 family peptidase [Pseudoalteromonas luteoviolacea]